MVAIRPPNVRGATTNSDVSQLNLSSLPLLMSMSWECAFCRVGDSISLQRNCETSIAHIVKRYPIAFPV